MFEGLYMDDKDTHPRLVRLAREVGAELPLPPVEAGGREPGGERQENGDGPLSPSPWLDTIRNLLGFGTRRA